jgi:hypothetical protein
MAASGDFPGQYDAGGTTSNRLSAGELLLTTGLLNAGLPSQPDPRRATGSSWGPQHQRRISKAGRGNARVLVAPVA